MAHNRMYLRCRGCGEEIMLGKCLSSGWYFSIPEQEKGYQLQRFLEKHSHCCEELEEDTCGGVSPFDSFNFEPFELTYENRDDWQQKPSLQDIDKQLHPEKYRNE